MIGKLCIYVRRENGFVCKTCGHVVPSSGFVRVCPVLREHHDSIETDPEIYRRIAVCETCPDYMDNQRCKSIDMGCRRTYRQQIKVGDCPRNKWD